MKRLHNKPTDKPGKNNLVQMPGTVDLMPMLEGLRIDFGRFLNSLTDRQLGQLHQKLQGPNKERVFEFLTRSAYSPDGSPNISAVFEQIEKL